MDMMTNRSSPSMLKTQEQVHRQAIRSVMKRYGCDADLGVVMRLGSYESFKMRLRAVVFVEEAGEPLEDVRLREGLLREGSMPTIAVGNDDSGTAGVPITLRPVLANTEPFGRMVSVLM